VRHPLDLPEGLQHASPEAEPIDASTGSREGCPRAAVWSGWRQVDEMPAPACKIVNDPAIR
jgi:hypothetical protein